MRIGVLLIGRCLLSVFLILAFIAFFLPRPIIFESEHGGFACCLTRLLTAELLRIDSRLLGLVLFVGIEFVLCLSIIVALIRLIIRLRIAFIGGVVRLSCLLIGLCSSLIRVIVWLLIGLSSSLIRLIVSLLICAFLLIFRSGLLLDIRLLTEFVGCCLERGFVENIIVRVILHLARFALHENSLLFLTLLHLFFELLCLRCGTYYLRPVFPLTKRYSLRLLGYTDAFLLLRGIYFGLHAFSMHLSLLIHNRINEGLRSRTMLHSHTQFSG